VLATSVTGADGELMTSPLTQSATLAPGPVLAVPSPSELAALGWLAIIVTVHRQDRG
jgi:hypothetical protein